MCLKTRGFRISGNTDSTPLAMPCWHLPAVALVRSHQRRHHAAAPVGHMQAYIALHSVLPSFISQDTFAPTFHPSPLTLCSLSSSILTVAMPFSSIVVTVPVIMAAVARVVPSTRLAQVKAIVFPSVRSMLRSFPRASALWLLCTMPARHRALRLPCPLTTTQGSLYLV